MNLSEQENNEALFCNNSNKDHLNDSLTDIVCLYECIKEKSFGIEETKIGFNREMRRLDENKKIRTETKKIKPWLIPQENLYKRLWDMVIMLIVIYVAVKLPFRLAFEES